MVTTITEVLNIWNEMGVFSYVIPFLLIFAVVFAILDKTKLLGSENRFILAIISASVGLLSLQFDFVSEFFAVIFPRFGIGLALFLTIIIILGFFSYDSSGKPAISIKVFGWIVGVGVFIWALSSWDQWSGQVGFGGWFVQNVWALIILGALIAVIVIIARKRGGD